MTSQDHLKKLAAERAVESVQSGMVLGLGTGSTAHFVVARIGELMAQGKLRDLVGVPTSRKTEEQAKSLGIPISTLDEHPEIDLAIDGADEVDPHLDLVKGRGGALLREKMVERAASELIIVVDDSKIVERLGVTGAMPVEVVQFCWRHTARQLAALGCEAKQRQDGGKPYVTDNGNFIIDLFFDQALDDAERLAEQIAGITGVVEHGLFLGMATEVVVAAAAGVRVLERG